MPKILVISLQRFSQFSDSTIKTEIDFPNIIVLSYFIDKDYLKGKAVFTLLGLANHIGNRNFGHYFAYINLSNCWYNFNDEHVAANNKDNSSENYYYALYVKND